ncbi:MULTISPECIES: hypothetical protein [Clostridium]|uniref:hypothetical protein n=1 Tax=Clostridium TaxID=1485 RepID=UPI00069FDFE2|nr:MULTISPECIES: hypothetical protein [Clostridium]KOF56687.1 hypothetical protein AGR56_08200 [Clostridium sp. DMHC 10]MCD2346686.1 hypothetical protein [Clostridium guangxiense]
MKELKSRFSRLIEALFYELLVSIILVIVVVMGYIEWKMFILIIGCFTIWPIYEFIYSFCIKNIKDSKTIQKLNIKISIYTWLIITIVLWVCNIMTDKSTLWAVYPTIGVACWPIIVSIKYFYNYKINKKV